MIAARPHSAAKSIQRIFLLCAFLVLRAAYADWSFDAASGAFYNSNLSNSDRASEEEHDWSWQTQLRAADGFQLGRDLRLIIGGDLHSAVWAQYSGFDEISGGLSALLRYRFGLGRDAPWISVQNRIGYSAFRETFRDGWDEAAHLRGGFSLTDRIRVEGGYTYENSCTRDEDIWSWCAHRGEIALIIDLTSQLQLSIGYSYRDGDVVSYAIPPRPEVRAVAKAVEETNTTFDEPRTAYKFDARTHAVSALASYAVTKYLAVQVGYEYRATSHDSLDYDNHLITAQLAFAY